MRSITFLLTLFILLTACTKEKSRYIIGVSQCSDDEWRHKMNNEITREALFYDGVSVEIRQKIITRFRKRTLNISLTKVSIC